MNKLGSQVVTDLYTQFFLSGYTFGMQTGTEDAPVTTNGPTDDTKPVLIADNGSGFMMPLRASVQIGAQLTSTIIAGMLEVDMDKARYSSGGTVFVPEQLNGAATSADAANGTFFEITGSDIVAAAKSAVPASVEVVRQILSEDAIADPGVGQLGGLPALYDVRRDGPLGMATPGSILVHFGSATADITGYAQLHFAQMSSSLVW